MVERLKAYLFVEASPETISDSPHGLIPKQAKTTSCFECLEEILGNLSVQNLSKVSYLVPVLDTGPQKNHADVLGLYGERVGLFFSSFECFCRFDAVIFVTHPDNENRFLYRVKKIVGNDCFFDTEAATAAPLNIPFDLKKQDDIMWATPVLDRDKTTSDEPVNLSFNHILSAITLKFKKADDIKEEMILLSISMENYPSTIQLNVKGDI